MAAAHSVPADARNRRASVRRRGGSIIDSSAIMVLAEVSGVASPDGLPNGEIIITPVPEPTTLALVGLSGLSLMLFRRKRK